MKFHNYFIYITTNASRTVLYTGVTNNLTQRIIEHYLNRGNPKTFAGRYYCYNLIYHEWFQYIDKAFSREKQIKGWTRKKKEELIELTNPQWKVLNYEIVDDWPPKDGQSREK